MGHTCRACMNFDNTNEMISMYEGNVAEIFSKCTSLEANESDGLPSFVCFNCHTQLIGYNDFRLLCTSSDQQFRQNVKIERDQILFSNICDDDGILFKESKTLVWQNIGKKKKDRNNREASGSRSTSTQIINLDIQHGEMKDEDIIKEEISNLVKSENGLHSYGITIESDPAENVEEESKEFIEFEENIETEDIIDDCVNDDNDEDDDDDNNDEDEDDEDNVILSKYLKQTDPFDKVDGIDINIKNEGSDEKKPLICSICNKKFIKLHRLEGHLRQHEGLKPCVCKICGKEFSKWTGLTMHIKTAHNASEKEVQKFTCDFEDCKKTYGMKQSLMSHKRKAHQTNIESDTTKSTANYICESCGKSFKTNCALKKHTYIHTGLMPFSCTICPKKYATKHKLKEHTMRHDGIKNHICPFCGLRKTTPHELKVHINYHTREKLYPCKLCSAVFSSIGNMSRHIKIVHCGIKAFNCSFCERSFGKAETLKHHEMTHTGERPHGCAICNKRFIQSIALQTHMKTHNKV